MQLKAELESLELEPLIIVELAEIPKEEAGEDGVVIVRKIVNGDLEVTEDEKAGTSETRLKRADEHEEDNPRIYEFVYQVDNMREFSYEGDGTPLDEAMEAAKAAYGILPPEPEPVADEWPSIGY